MKRDCIISLIIGLGRENKIIPLNKPFLRTYDAKALGLACWGRYKRSPASVSSQPIKENCTVKNDK